MKIIALMENHVACGNISSEHGLSLYVQCNGQKILFDAGASGLFAANARQMGVDLSAIDFAVLSHGHYDHSGGFFEFMRQNGRAPIYMKPEAAGEYYAAGEDGENRYIGVDRRLFTGHAGRIRFTGQHTEAAQGCHIVTDLHSNAAYASLDPRLQMGDANGLAQDRFLHELMMVIVEDGEIAVFTGCGHNGVINLLETAMDLFPGLPVKAVIGGFHLLGPTPDSMGCSDGFLDLLADRLARCGQIFTCHCTGRHAILRLRKQLGGRLHELNAGQTIEV